MNAGPWRTWPMLALLALAMLPLTPSTSAPLSSFPDIRQVQERGALRVGLVAKDIPPLLVTGGDGQPAGIEVAMANAWRGALRSSFSPCELPQPMMSWWHR